MFCPKCGHDNPNDAKFCGNCNFTILSVLQSPTMQSMTIGEPSVSPGMKAGIIIGTIFIPILGIIMGIIYLKDTNPEKKRIGRIWLYIGIGMTVFSFILGVLMGILSSMSQQYYYDY